MMMKKNMGSIDRTLRLLVAVLFVVLYATEVITGTWGIIVMVLAIIFAVTGFIGFCPLYLPFGISTMKKK